MFDSLKQNLGNVFDRLKSRGALSESDIKEATREIRVALLEADVALPVAREFLQKIEQKALGADVIKGVNPGQMVVKIVHDELVDMLGRETVAINLNAPTPVPILMVGLQGSGKTTTTAKISKRLAEKQNKKVLMASLDVHRPAAQEQLEILGRQINVVTLPIIKGQTPAEIADRAMDTARKEGFDVVMLDTAGRLHIDEVLMNEVADVRKRTNPADVLLVTDAMTGQDAVNIAREFNEKVGVTGIVLTRIDGDARGGAALSMRAVTGCPIKLLGVGEKMDALEDFHPDRMASRILDMGDVVSLVERASELVDEKEAEKMAAKMRKGQFDLDDLLSQLRQMKKMGGLSSVLGFLPGVGKIKKQMAAANVDDGMLKKQEAVILSMTPKERRRPEIIKASRKQRIAAGSGTDVPTVNRLLKQFQQMNKMMKTVQKMEKQGKLPKNMKDLGNMFPPQS